MRKLFVVLWLVACSRESVVQSPNRPVDKTDTSTTRQLENSPPPPAVTGPKLPFIDEAANDPSFLAYREKLLTAVRARDKNALLALSDPHIRTTFGGDGDAAELERALNEDLWRELEQILTLGGSFREGMFWAPYVYSNWPESQDAFETFAIVADDVPLRTSPDPGSPAIATLSRDLVTRAGDPGPWQKVTTADGKTGFVEAKFARSPVDYRAGFAHDANGWSMNALVAGD